VSIRPSSLPALKACPRFVPDHHAGEEDKSAGTLRHDVLFRVLGGDAAALDELGEPDREGVEWAAEYIRTHAPMADHELQREVKREYLTDGFVPIRGTPDVTCGPVLFDLKWREDVSDYAPQLAAYALMMGHENVRAYILYALHRRAEVIEFTRESASAIVEPIVEAASAPNAAPTACSYCGWCAHRLTCSAVMASVEKVQSSPPPDSIITADQMGEWLATADVVEEWAKAVKARAKVMAFKEGIIPTGYKPVTRAGNREIPDIAAAFGRCGLPQPDFLAACKVSFTKLSEAYAAFAGMKKAPAERDLETKLGDAMQRAPSIQYLRPSTKE